MRIKVVDFLRALAQRPQNIVQLSACVLLTGLATALQSGLLTALPPAPLGTGLLAAPPSDLPTGQLTPLDH